MGAWGSGAFENDMATDWVARLRNKGQISDIEDALVTLVEWPDDQLPADDCSYAVAAAETVCAARGFAGRKFPRELKKWITDYRFTADDQLSELAVRAVQRVLTDSELAELWEDDSAWLKGMQNLVKRLSKSAKLMPAPKSAAKGADKKGVNTHEELVRILKRKGAAVSVYPDGDIEGIHVRDFRMTEETMSWLDGLTKLRGLSLGASKIRNEDLKWIVDSTAL